MGEPLHRVRKHENQFSSDLVLGYDWGHLYSFRDQLFNDLLLSFLIKTTITNLLLLSHLVMSNSLQLHGL